MRGKGHPLIPILDIVKCLDLFKEDEHKHKLNPELAKLASDFLKLDYTLKKDAITVGF